MLLSLKLRPARVAFECGPKHEASSVLEAAQTVRVFLFKPMKSHTEYLTFTVPARMDFREHHAAGRGRRPQERRPRRAVPGATRCTSPPACSSTTTNPGLHADYKKWLEQLAPFDASPQRYAHNRTGEDNADAHLKRQVMGREVVVAITKGKLDFGPWEQIFYGEFDGRRPKRVLVKVIGE